MTAALIPVGLGIVVTLPGAPDAPMLTRESVIVRVIAGLRPWAINSIRRPAGEMAMTRASAAVVAGEAEDRVSDAARMGIPKP
jgi:hypothetical protein